MLMPPASAPRIATMSDISRPSFRFFERLRVRWAEVDAQQIVFNGHYLMYVDTAIAGYWRALALPYHDTMAALQGDLFVRKATLEYEASARYDEQLAVGVRCQRVGKSSMLMLAAVFRGERCLVHGELVYVFADPATQTSKPVPPLLRECFAGFEAGEPMTTLQLGGWADLGTPVLALREAVFADELGATAAAVADEADASAVQAVVVNRAGRPLACGRLLAPVAGVGQIGRLACLASMRGSGLGRQVLDALVAAGRARGDRALTLQAAATALSFYERAGFVRDGADSIEAGIAHLGMRRVL
jgi:YbgC/YbaW family acyl-CoA thioester hydrolase